MIMDELEALNVLNENVKSINTHVVAVRGNVSDIKSSVSSLAHSNEVLQHDFKTFMAEQAKFRQNTISPYLATDLSLARERNAILALVNDNVVSIREHLGAELSKYKTSQDASITALSGIFSKNSADIQNLINSINKASSSDSSTTVPEPSSPVVDSSVSSIESSVDKMARAQEEFLSDTSKTFSSAAQKQESSFVRMNRSLDETTTQQKKTLTAFQASLAVLGAINVKKYLDRFLDISSGSRPVVQKLAHTTGTDYNQSRLDYQGIMKSGFNDIKVNGRLGKVSAFSKEQIQQGLEDAINGGFSNLDHIVKAQHVQTLTQALMPDVDMVGDSMNDVFRMYKNGEKTLKATALTMKAYSSSMYIQPSELKRMQDQYHKYVLGMAQDGADYAKRMDNIQRAAAKMSNAGGDSLGVQNVFNDILNKSQSDWGQEIHTLLGSIGMSEDDAYQMALSGDMDAFQDKVYAGIAERYSDFFDENGELKKRADGKYDTNAVNALKEIAKTMGMGDDFGALLDGVKKSSRLKTADSEARAAEAKAAQAMSGNMANVDQMAANDIQSENYMSLSEEFKRSADQLLTTNSVITKVSNAVERMGIDAETVAGISTILTGSEALLTQIRDILAKNSGEDIEKMNSEVAQAKATASKPKNQDSDNAEAAKNLSEERVQQLSALMSNPNASKEDSEEFAKSLSKEERTSILGLLQNKLGDEKFAKALDAGAIGMGVVGLKGLMDTLNALDANNNFGSFEGRRAADEARALGETNFATFTQDIGGGINSALQSFSNATHIPTTGLQEVVGNVTSSVGSIPSAARHVVSGEGIGNFVDAGLAAARTGVAFGAAGAIDRGIRHNRLGEDAPTVGGTISDGIRSIFGRGPSNTTQNTQSPEAEVSREDTDVRIERESRRRRAPEESVSEEMSTNDSVISTTETPNEPLLESLNDLILSTNVLKDSMDNLSSTFLDVYSSSDDNVDTEKLSPLDTSANGQPIVEGQDRYERNISSDTSEQIETVPAESSDSQIRQLQSIVESLTQQVELMKDFIATVGTPDSSMEVNNTAANPVPVVIVGDTSKSPKLQPTEPTRVSNHILGQADMLSHGA